MAYLWNISSSMFRSGRPSDIPQIFFVRRLVKQLKISSKSLSFLFDIFAFFANEKRFNKSK